jgi:hypothetical protein
MPYILRNVDDYLECYGLTSIWDLEVEAMSGDFNLLNLPDGGQIWVCGFCGQLAEPDDRHFCPELDFELPDCFT